VWLNPKSRFKFIPKLIASNKHYAMYENEFSKNVRSNFILRIRTFLEF
jgi:hypothetical protein